MLAHEFVDVALSDILIILVFTIALYFMFTISRRDD